MVEPVYTIVQKYMREYLNFEITICDKLAIYGLPGLSQDDCDKLYCYLWIAQLVQDDCDKFYCYLWIAQLVTR